MSRISESELILPVLHILSSKDMATTSELIGMLRDLLHPSGEDLEILAGRRDDKFSQKVRNLKAHNTLTSRGFVREAQVNGPIAFAITDKGKELYHTQKENLESLFSFQLDKTQQILSNMAKDKKITILTDNMISEGGVTRISQNIRGRSRILRNAAIEHFTENGYIECLACSFEFSRAYGCAGKKYIEIHHLTPICEYEGDTTLDLDTAIQNVAPLCANCHRVVHLHSPILSVEEVRNSLSDHI